MVAPPVADNVKPPDPEIVPEKLDVDGDATDDIKVPEPSRILPDPVPESVATV